MNLLWAVAIGGVAVSVGPALYVLASPFQRLLAVVFLRAAALVSQVPPRFWPNQSALSSESLCLMLLSSTYLPVLFA